MQRLKKRLTVSLCIAFFLSLLTPVLPSAQAENCALNPGTPYRKPNLTTVYVVTPECQKRPIFNPDVYFSHFESWNSVVFKEDVEIDVVPDHPLQFLPWGERRVFGNGSLIKTTDDPKVYLVGEGVAHPIKDETVFKELGFAFNLIEDVTPEVISQFEPTTDMIEGASDLPPSSAFKYADDPKVYVLTKEGETVVKKYVTDEATLAEIYRTDRVATIPNAITFTASTSTPSLTLAPVTTPNTTSPTGTTTSPNTTTAPNVTTAPAVSNTGLIAHWMLDETSGTTARNAVNSLKHRGVYVNNPTVYEAKVGVASRYFNGNSKYVRIPDHSDFEGSQRTELTVSAWVKVMSLPQTNRGVVGKGVGAFVLLMGGGEREWQWGVGTGLGCNVYVPETATAGEWHHLTGTFTGGSRCDLYLDGVSIGSDTTDIPAFVPNTSDSVTIGSYNLYNGYINGAIDDVRIYSRVLTADEIRELAGVDDEEPPPPPPPADTTAPTVSITAPAENATVSGSSVSVTATASDNVGVASVAFTVDGGATTIDTTSPYEFILNSTTLTDGSHTVSARATDAVGNAATATRTFTVNNTVTPPPPPPPPPGGGLTLDPSGWSVIPRGTGSRTIYVSTSGNDNNSGLTESAPVATVRRAFQIANGGDWVLLKRGDTFIESIDTWKNGPSPSAMTLLSAYGDESLPRPVIDPPYTAGFYAGLSGDIVTLENFALTSLHFYNRSNDSNSPEWTGSPDNGISGVTIHTPGNNVLLEDLHIEFFNNNLNVQALTVAPIENVTLRRSVINNSWKASANGHSQGLYAYNAKNFLVEENYFDHNGHNPVATGAFPTKFNHNLYIQTQSSLVTVRNNIVARGSSHGIQLRPGGVMEGNVLLGNGIGGFVSNDNIQPGEKQVIQKNVVLNGATWALGENGIDGTRGWGLSMIVGITGTTSIGSPLTFTQNVIANTPAGTNPLFVDALYNGIVDTTQNVFYNWGTTPNSTGPFPNPGRTIESYQTSIGQTPTIDAFINQMRQQRRGNWYAEYKPQNVAKYFLEGYGITAP